MTKDELIGKLNDLEWEDFEVKEAKASVPKSCWSTVSAFANTAGGWLIFGIKEVGKKYEIQGVANAEKIEQDFLNTLRSDKFNVFVDSRQSKYTIDNKMVLAFYIPISAKKPVYYNTQANTFIRRGSSDQRATKEEIDAMYRDQTFGTKTSELAPGTTKADIHESSLKQYRDYMSRFNPDVSYNRFEEDEFLNKLRILDHGGCTYAGLLFLGKRESIERHFPDFRIDLLEIPGTSISDATSNYTFRLDEYENLWDYYFECFKRLKPEVDVEFKLTNQGFGQELSAGLKTIRETLVNMLMHADYFSPAHARIRIFTDHIEFFNPGGLPKPLEELKAKDLSLPRNPLISKLFRMVRLAENAGYGFDKIESNWSLYNGTLPEYEISFDSTILKLYTQSEEKNGETSEKLRRDFGELSEQIRSNILDKSLSHSEIQKLLRDNYGVITGQLRGNYGVKIEAIQELKGERALWILMLILIMPHITKQQMAEVLGASVSTIEKTMQSLRKEQIIHRVGSAKTGKWVITNIKKKE